MHFIGMLAAPLPADSVYLVLPTIVSFLMCALVVGVSLFFVSIGPASLLRVASSAALLTKMSRSALGHIAETQSQRSGRNEVEDRRSPRMQLHSLS